MVGKLTDLTCTGQASMMRAMTPSDPGPSAFGIVKNNRFDRLPSGHRCGDRLTARSHRGLLNVAGMDSYGAWGSPLRLRTPERRTCFLSSLPPERFPPPLRGFFVEVLSTV